MAEILRFTVEEKYDRTNAGRYLRTVCKLSARTLSILKRTPGSLLCNGELLRSVDIIFSGDIIEIQLPSEEFNVVPVEGEIDILYEDNFMLIVNKPAGMPVHPVKVHQEDTLANIIAYKYGSADYGFVFRAVNRLDRDTSGIVIVAKDRHISSLLQKTDIEKHYIAVCHGETPVNGTVDAPIKLKSNSKIVRCVSTDGQFAVTHYTKVLGFANASVIDLILETGRTHQIRCHMSSIGFPLFGDDLYGGSLDTISRQALHCRSVSFKHPITGENIHVSAELPEDIKELINTLSGGGVVENKK